MWGSSSDVFHNSFEELRSVNSSTFDCSMDVFPSLRGKSNSSSSEKLSESSKSLSGSSSSASEEFTKSSEESGSWGSSNVSSKDWMVIFNSS